jgi:hypothetical protein
MSEIVALCAVLGCAVLGGAAPAIAAPAPAAVTPAPSITGITAITAIGTGIFTLSKISCASGNIGPASGATESLVSAFLTGSQWTLLSVN